MVARVNEIVVERRQALAEQLYRLRDEPVEVLREVSEVSANGIRSLKAPVRAVAHSGIRLATVSQRTLQNLIELETEALTSALTDAAVRLDRAAKAEGVVDLVRDQVALLPATRERVTDEAIRAVAILRHAGREVRTIGTRLYGKFIEPAEAEIPKAKARVRKVARAVRKPAARVH